MVAFGHFYCPLESPRVPSELNNSEGKGTLTLSSLLRFWQLLKGFCDASLDTFFIPPSLLLHPKF